MISKRRHLVRGLCSLTAAITNLVQASEFIDDILEDKNHFLGPKEIKVVFWVILVLLTAQEIEKTRNRFEEVIK